MVHILVNGGQTLDDFPPAEPRVNQYTSSAGRYKGGVSGAAAGEDTDF